MKEDKITSFIENVNEAAKDADKLADAAEEVVDAAEAIGKEVGGLLSRILKVLEKPITYFKGLFNRKG